MTYPQKMPPLTIITMLVYDLVKVIPTTRALPALRLREGSPACHKKKSRQAALADKKNRANN